MRYGSQNEQDTEDQRFRGGRMEKFKKVLVLLLIVLCSYEIFSKDDNSNQSNADTAKQPDINKPLLAVYTSEDL